VNINSMNITSINMNPMKVAPSNMNPMNMNTTNTSLDAAALGKMAVGTPLAKLAAKEEKAARDFESILLGSVFDSLEKTFTWDSDSGPVGSSAYGTLATKALADTVAASGGIGIARLILRHLPHDEGRGPGMK
jgi:Rod binding domain-containing protein